MSRNLGLVTSLICCRRRPILFLAVVKLFISHKKYWHQRVPWTICYKNILDMSSKALSFVPRERNSRGKCMKTRRFGAVGPSATH